MKKSIFILTVLSIVFSTQAHAGLLFNYSQLMLKDLDQMNEMVLNKVEESKKEENGKVVPLKEALQAVYARPNDDQMIDKVVGPLRTQLDELDSWEKVLSQLTDEAVNALKNPKAFKPAVQVTYLVFLENLLSEVKPYLKTDGFERKLAERVRNAKIEVTREAANERSLRTMKKSTSPSELAGKILAEVPVTPVKATESSAQSAASGQ